MSKKTDRELTPFEKTKKNIQVFAENMSICESSTMLVEAAKCIEDLDDGERKAVETILEHTLSQLSSLIEERGYQWD